MYLDRTYRPRRRRQGWGRFWPLYLVAVIGVILYEQQPAWLAPRSVTPTPVPTRAAIAFMADANMALAAGDYDVTITALQRVIELEPLNAEALVELSQIQLMFGRDEQARNYAQRAVDAAPQNPAALTALARALNWTGDNEAAINAAFDALEVAPDDATALAVLGEIYTDEGNREQAEHYLDEALKKEPKNVTALRNRSYYLEVRGDYEAAIATLQEAITVAPKRFDLYIELGRQYRVGLLDYEKANEAYTKAVAAYEAPITLDAQGDGLYNTGDHLQAVRVLRKAIEIDPNYGPALVHLGMALYARRNYEDAAPSLEKGLRLIGDHARVEQLYTAGLAYINKEPRDCQRAVPWLLKALAMNAEASPAIIGLKACDIAAPTATPAEVNP
jgi:tetratricopeptide (TPR) repeat protein